MTSEEKPLSESLALITGLAFGGENNAWAPEDDFSDFPKAEGSPGTESAKEWFKERYERGGSTGAMLVLVGGPGNGKSLLLSDLTKDYEPLDGERPDIPQRTYRYGSDGKVLRFINDATIGLNCKKGEESLVDDFTDAIEEGDWLVAAINRGVLIEEIANAENNKDDSPGLEIVEWLNSNRKGALPGNYKYLIDQSEGSNSSYIDSVHIQVGEKKFDLIVVFMDACSLCEQTPEVAIRDEESALKIEASAYKVNQYKKRDDEFTKTTCGGKLLDKLFSHPEGFFSFEEGMHEQKWNPIVANLSALRKSSNQTAILSLLRASEIASGTRFTWRTFWGILSHAVVGHLADPVFPPPLEWVHKNSPISFADPEDLDSNESRQQLESILKLSEIRTHQGIFGKQSCDLTSDVVEEEKLSQFSPLLLSRQVDPILDPMIGHYDEDDSSFAKGWSSLVDEAFEGAEGLHSPLASLRKSIEDTFGSGNPFEMAVTEFDLQLDACIKNALSGHSGKTLKTDKEKERLLIWYGRYLTRLFAYAFKIPAFITAIYDWTRIWDEAYDSPRLRDEDAMKISAFLSPKYKGNNFFLLPIFDSRTVPLTGDERELILAKKVSAADQDWKWSLDGDSIMVSLFGATKDDEKPKITLDVDFGFIREMDACSEGYLGATESSLSTEPILERSRASLLGETMRSEITVHQHGGDLIKLEILERET